MNTQELARELGHPEARSCSRAPSPGSPTTDTMASRGSSPSGSTGPANASLSPLHQPPRRSARFRPARKSH